MRRRRGARGRARGRALHAPQADPPGARHRVAPLRTLVISDLHLGARGGADVLRRPEPREALRDALAGVERLVLLGDVVELRHGPVRAVLDAARPVLADLAGTLPAGAEVVLVPGNHDHELLAPWLARRALDAAAPPLGLESAVDWREGEPLGLIAEWLGPERVRAAYPGVWLRADVYATHGHYGDRHTTVPMFERLGAGVMARIVAQGDGAPSAAEDYEAVLAPMYAWVHALAQAGVAGHGSRGHGPSTRAWRALNGRGRVRRLVLGAAVPAAVGALDLAGLGPLRADLSAPELRRAGLAAFREVVGRLGVEARHVLFGHTHRAGPLPGDARGEWTAGPSTALLNTGCWVHEAIYLGRSPATSPYRAGFGAVLDGEAAPRLVNLLD